MIQALSCSTFWELVLSEALRNHQRSGGAANVHSSFKLCHCVATHPLQWRGVSHRRLQKSTCPHSHINIFFSFDAPIPDIGPGRGKGAFRVCGIKLCQMFTVKLLRMRWRSGQVKHLSSVIQLKPIHWEYRGCLLIHSRHGCQAVPSLGIKATFIEIYGEPHCSRLKMHHMAAEIRWCWWWESWPSVFSCRARAHDRCDQNVVS